MKIYISGPMAGRQVHNRNSFKAVADKLSAIGHEPISPLDISADHRSHGDKGKCPPGYSPGVACFLRNDFRVLLDCDAILMILDWENSVGAQREHSIACWSGIKIYYSWKEVPNVNDPTGGD